MEVKISNLSFYYDKKTKNRIIDSINLKIKNNTIVSITGKSGSGKTTLVELIGALKIPNSGKITIGDIVINKKKIFDDNILKKAVSYVPQNCEYQLFNKTVYDELTYPFKFKNEKIERDKVIEYLNLVDLNESFLDRNPLALSTGEKRKVVIASTLLLNTDIIIFDEPSVGLDSKSIKNFIRLLKNLKNNFAKTIIVVSRDIEFIHKISDQIVILHEGKIIADGDKYTAFNDVDLLNKYGLSIPKTMEFSNLVLSKKNVKIGYRDEINDLLKDIYRYVR